MEDIESIKAELSAIKERNRRVEAEKAWEQSWLRKAGIFLATYLIAGIVFAIIDVQHPWRNAVIPSIAYLLSMQSLPFLKKYWISRYMQAHEPK